MSSHVLDKIYLDILFKISLDVFVSKDTRYDASRKVSEFDTSMNIMINAVTEELHDS